MLGATLGEMILRHPDNLSQYLQKKTISTAEGQHVAKMVINTFQSVRTEELYDLFWQKLLHFSECNNVQEAQMPRPQNLPAWYEDGLSRAHIPASPNEHYRRLYFEAIDTAIGCLKDRFDQAGYTVYHNLEELLIKASLKENFEFQFKFVCKHYKDDLNPDVLHSQLLVFGNHFQSTNERPIYPSVFDIKDFFVKLSTIQKNLLE